MTTFALFVKRAAFALLLVFLAHQACAQHVFFEGARQDVIIDVRTPAEFAAGHLDGARNIPVEILRTDKNAMRGIARESHILLYCRSGRRSAEALAILKRQGYLNIKDGGAITTVRRNIKTCQSDYHC